VFPYTLVQLLEVVLFGGLVIYGVLARSPTMALLGGGLLIGKAVVNILAAEGGTVLRRSLLGYAVGAVFVLAGVVAGRLLG
jgi:hypothetical protein